jgi:hypothetical protein
METLPEELLEHVQRRMCGPLRLHNLCEVQVRRLLCLRLVCRGWMVLVHRWFMTPFRDSLFQYLASLPLAIRLNSDTFLYRHLGRCIRPWRDTKYLETIKYSRASRQQCTARTQAGLRCCNRIGHYTTRFCGLHHRRLTSKYKSWT